MLTRSVKVGSDDVARNAYNHHDITTPKAIIPNLI
jgi:hypothetical protein